MKNLINYRNFAIIITGIFLGFLIILQSRSFRGVEDLFGRDTRANIFREIQILKTTDENLSDEIIDLEDQLTKASDRQQALNAIQDEIRKDRILVGHVDVDGPGVEVTVKKDVAVLWLTDLANELWSAGAEAVSVNNIRLVNDTVGFDTLPNGQISLNGVLLSPPYTFRAIGDSKTLYQALNQPLGILDRFKESHIEAGLEAKEKIKIEKVL